ncbi:MAG: hypothetical protein FJY29_07210, partial [Betaproteobacteria bacterium]|nr:hypothetical protein [Betaproteobacteria bacterium]
MKEKTTEDNAHMSVNKNLTEASPQTMSPGAHLYPKDPLGERIPGIPTGRDVDWQPLVDYRRNGVSETTIHGAVAWASGGKL